MGSSQMGGDDEADEKPIGNSCEVCIPSLAMHPKLCTPPAPCPTLPPRRGFPLALALLVPVAAAASLTVIPRGRAELLTRPEVACRGRTTPVVTRKEPPGRGQATRIYEGYSNLTWVSLTQGEHPEENPPGCLPQPSSHKPRMQAFAREDGYTCSADMTPCDNE